MSIKAKSCEIMQELQYYDTNDLKEIEKRILTLNNLKTYAIVIHDRDLKDNGELKPQHFHAVLTFNNSTTFEVISKKLKVPIQYINKIKSSTIFAQLYLIHKLDPNKYQYSVDDVLSNFDYKNFVENNGSNKPFNDKEKFAQMIANGEIKEYNYTDYISVEEYAKNKRYYQNCFEYRISMIKGLERNMECIFIWGDSGTGKTTFAKKIAADRNFNAYVSSGGKNPLDNYRGEECIILDDIRSSTWALNDLLKLTDNHTDSLVGARYYNKYIGECKLLIATSVISLENFYENVTKEDKEPLHQLFRRFKTMFYLQEKLAAAYRYDETRRTIISMGKFLNPVALIFNKEVINETKENFMKTFKLEIYEEPKQKPQMRVLSEDEDLPF